MGLASFNRMRKQQAEATEKVVEVVEEEATKKVVDKKKKAEEA